MSKRPEWILVCALLAIAAPAAAQIPETISEAAKQAALSQAEKDALAAQWVAEGKRYFEGAGKTPKNHKRAYDLFLKAAEFRNAEANYYLGSIYEAGIAFPVDDDLAFSYYLTAANLGYAKAQMAVGVHYILKGIHMKPHSREQQTTYSTAVDWLKQAAEKDDADAQYWYGDMLIKGLGTEKDEAKGVALLRKSAEAQNPNGQAMLGALYWQGQAGLQKNPVQAYTWLSRSLANGNENAEALLMRVSKEMSAEQIAAAKKAMDALPKADKNAK